MSSLFKNQVRKWIPAFAGIYLALTACGFEPMAGKSTRAYEGQALPSALAAVEIQAEGPETARMIGQDFRIALEDMINPGGHHSGKEYLLSVWLSPVIQPGFIAPDGKAQRFLVRLESTYSLTRLSDGRVLENGRMYRSSSYSNLPNSYYSTYIAEQDSIRRLSKELAEQYRMKLASILSSPPKKPSMEEVPLLENLYPIPVQPEQAIEVPLGQTF